MPPAPFDRPLPRFLASSVGAVDPAAANAAECGPALLVRIEPAGWVFAASPETTLLQAALQAGIELPSSCRNGTCRTCLCASQGAPVRYATAWPGVSADERRAGDILPCVAYASGDLVLLQPGAKLVGGSTAAL